MGKGFMQLSAISSQDEHLIGNPQFPLRILEREMHLIERDYRESLLREMKNQDKVVFLDYSQKANYPLPKSLH